ncbi:MAG: aspartate--tRNA(Asn) ligase [Candidatus Diapherotrites archaeon]|nr:aspartate--tRNA(Asn) ligase [Candidatus Diapherotrites archaeon]
MKRTHYTNELEGQEGRGVTVAGWVDQLRMLGKIGFIVLRDRYGTVQVTMPKSKVGVIYDEAAQLTKESVIAVKGELKQNKDAPGGREIIPDTIEVLSKAEVPLPMDVSGKITSELETRLDSRFMDLRQPAVTAVFTVRDSLLTGIREYLEGEGFVEVHTPKIVEAGAEGGATLFPIDYFGKKAFLTQSPQLFKQALMATGLDKVYEIAPAFRAEPSATTKHVSEFISLDFEMAFIESQEDVMRATEEMVAAAIKHTKKEAAEELELLGKDVVVPKTPFKRITFTEAKDMLAKEGKEIGNDLDSEAEKLLGELVGEEFYFITGFPHAEKPFYIMEDGEFSQSFDLGYLGLELASGGQREHRHGELEARMKKLKLKPKDFRFYLSAFKYGMPPHGGVGLGVDRLVQKLLGLANVREAVLFPRDKTRLVP